MSDEIKKETSQTEEQVETNESSEQEESKEQQEQKSPQPLTAFEIEKIVEMKVQEILSKLQKADDIVVEEVIEGEDIEF